MAKVIGIAVALLAVLGLGFWLGSPPAHEHEHPSGEAAAEAMWTCSMHPQIELPEPGACPICGMDLIPRETASSPAATNADVWTCSMHPQIELPESGPCPVCGMDLIRRASPAATTATSSSEEVWTCSMHPQIELPEPGECPICGMDLILRTPSAPTGDRELTLSPEAAALARVRTTVAEHRAVHRSVRLVGEVAYDPTRLTDVTAHFAGRIERLFVDYPGMPVRRGDHLYQIYSPDLITAHEELRAARRALGRLGEHASPAVRASAERTVEATRDRLRRWGLSKRQVEQLETARKAPERMTIYAPDAGVVIEQAKLEGSYVETGTLLYRIADVDWVWVEAWAYEKHLPWIRFGQTVRFEVAAVPGRVFEGRVAYIDPFIDTTTRAARVRVSVPNPDGLLKPGMFARVVIEGALGGEGRLMEPALAGKWVCPMHPHVVEDAAGRCPVCGMRLVEAEALGYQLPDPDAPLPLVVPRSAPLWTGERAVLYVEIADAVEPRYEAREVVLGPEAIDGVVVREGLRAGERVVTEGNFKLDASLQIRAGMSMMNPAAAQPSSQPARPPASQPTSQPASQPTSQPTSHPVPAPTSRPVAGEAEQ